MINLSAIKLNYTNVQRGFVTIASSDRYANVTISPVNVDRTELREMSFTTATGTIGNFDGGIMVYFHDNSTLRFAKFYTSASSPQKIYWEITEW